MGGPWERPSSLLAAAASALVAVWALAGAAPASSPAGSPAEASYQSYLAHVAPASASLQLHRAAEAKRWIAQAPAQHRGWEWRFLAARR